MTEILETKNYSQFKRLEGNRNLNPVNLRNLKKAIENKNMLSFHPIIVNKDYYVIDGHHRLQVATDLNLPVYFLVEENVDKNQAYEHIITANVNKKSWTLEDFIHLYVKKDHNPNYIEFADMLEILQLKPKALIGLIIGASSSKLIHEMKRGEFKLPENIEMYRKVTDAYFQFSNFAFDRKIKPVSMFSNHYFTNSFRMLLLDERFDLETFFIKLEHRWFDLRPQPNAKEWLKLLLSIYNWKNHNKITIEE
ncbi:MAG: ParB/RepB/Spo0J family partition protein [Candidatus Rickettsiella isopodorum]|nr:ParB/RepB/Spo0J family partition protein [Candidatus Rickettsiella isopodorum]